MKGGQLLAILLRSPPPFLPVTPQGHGPVGTPFFTSSGGVNPPCGKVFAKGKNAWTRLRRGRATGVRHILSERGAAPCNSTTISTSILACYPTGTRPCGDPLFYFLGRNESALRQGFRRAKTLERAKRDPAKPGPSVARADDGDIEGSSVVCLHDRFSSYLWGHGPGVMLCLSARRGGCPHPPVCRRRRAVGGPMWASAPTAKGIPLTPRIQW